MTVVEFDIFKMPRMAKIFERVIFGIFQFFCQDFLGPMWLALENLYTQYKSGLNCIFFQRVSNEFEELAIQSSMEEP